MAGAGAGADAVPPALTARTARAPSCRPASGGTAPGCRRGIGDLGPARPPGQPTDNVAQSAHVPKISTVWATFT